MKYSFALVCVLLLCFLSGCGTKSETVYRGCWSNIAPVAETEDAIFYLNGHMLTRWEKDTGTYAYWCNAENCHHNMQEKECAAYCPRCFANTLCSDETYLYLAILNENQILVWNRYQIEQGAVSRKEMAEIWKPEQNMEIGMEAILHGDSIYYILERAEIGQKGNYALYRQDLNGKTAELLMQGEKGEVIENLSAVGDRLFFCIWSEQKGGLYSCQLNGKKMEPLLEDEFVTSYFFLDNQLYYSGQKEGVFRVDLKNGQCELLEETTEAGAQALISWDGNNIYVDNFNQVRPRSGQTYAEDDRNFQKRFTFVYDREGKLKNKITMSTMMGNHWFGNQDVMMACGDSGIWIFDKKKLEEGQPLEQAEKRTEIWEMHVLSAFSD